MFSRQDVLFVTAAGAVTASSAQAASFGKSGSAAAGAINAKGPENLMERNGQSLDRPDWSISCH